MSDSQQLFEENQLARHLGSGALYKVLQPNVLLESDKTPMVVYRSQYDGVIWTRPLHEFMLKFEPLKGSGTST
jgi:hypothetical protein